MSDRHVVALAVLVGAGAAFPLSIPWWIGGAAAALALLARRPVALCLAAGVLASALSARSWAGLDNPPTGTTSGVATLLSDPEWDRYGQLTADLRLGGRHFEAAARATEASAMQPRLAGERVWLAGTARPLSGRAAGHLRHRHIVARLEVTAVGDAWHEGNLMTRVGNRLRRTLERGASPLSDDHRGLLIGFLLGDARQQRPETRDDFRASGLAHLLAVSGQNVAIVLGCVGPFMRRLRLPGRLIAAAAVLAIFGTVTRWEPSVMRAVAMASAAVLSTTLGRPASSLRLLALAVAGLILVDPLLLGALGFRMSVAACAGIILLSAPIARRLAMPAVVGGPLAVTLAAQVGVAPVIVGAFGGVPLVAVPANLLAGPVAAPITVWGLSAGLVAGVMGDTVARVVHQPTSWLVGWVSLVARIAARLPVGELRSVHVAALGAFAALALARRLRRAAVAGAVVVAIGAAMTPALAARVRPVVGAELTPAPRLWRDRSATVLVVDRPDGAALAGELRRAGIATVDVLVAESGSATGVGAVTAAARAARVRLVIAPPGTRVAGAASASGVYEAGNWRIDVRPARARIVAAVYRAGDEARGDRQRRRTAPGARDEPDA